MAIRNLETLGFPSGWFVVAASAELQPGAVLARTFMGAELAIYRTESGLAQVLDAYCPHMGAHMGHCGAVQGELLRCNFHGFCFDSSGTCVSTSYGSRPPPRAGVRSWPVQEIGGVLLVYYDAMGLQPAWQVPPLDSEGWSPLRLHGWRLRGHPQEVAENSVDLGHLSVVHGFRDVQLIETPRLEGSQLSVHYRMKRDISPRSRLGAFELDFRIAAHGLGYSVVEVDIQPYGIRSRQFVFSTPTETGWMDLRIGQSVRNFQLYKGRLKLERRIGAALADTLSRLFLSMYKHDVAQDFELWRHKRYVAQPLLAKGDGPVGLYRKWTRQFYRALPVLEPAANCRESPVE